jgi:hypothetical protein
MWRCSNNDAPLPCRCPARASSAVLAASSLSCLLFAKLLPLPHPPLVLLAAQPQPPAPAAGEEVVFSEIVGMTELNGRAPLRVKNCKAHSFTLEIDSTDFGWVWGRPCVC